MRKRLALTLPITLVVLVLFGAIPALGLEIYGGASGVRATLSGMCTGATANPSFSGSCDDSSNGYKVFAGLQLIPLTAIEVGYIDFGKAEATGTLHGVSVSPQSSANATYAAFLLRGTFFDRLTAYGKVGVDYWRADGSLGQATLGTSQNANGTSYMYGVGLSFRVIGPVGVIAEYERYQNVGDESTTGRANINAFSLGLVVRF
jgi:opacity protein-like surface antigen